MKEDLGFERIVKSLTSYEIGMAIRICMNELVRREIENSEFEVSNAFRSISYKIKNKPK